MNRTTAQLLQGQGRVQNKLSGLTSALGGVFAKGLQKGEDIEMYQKKADIDLTKSKELADYNREKDFIDYVDKDAHAIKMAADKTFTQLYGVTREQRPDLWEKHLVETASQAFDTHLAGLKATQSEAKLRQGTADETESTRVLTQPDRTSTAQVNASTELGLAQGRKSRIPLTNRALDFNEIYKPASQLQDLHRGEMTPITPGVSYDIRPWQGGTRSMFRTPTSDEVLTSVGMGKPTPQPTLSASPLGTVVGTRPNGQPLYGPQESGDPINNIINRFKPAPSGGSELPLTEFNTPVAPPTEPSFGTSPLEFNTGFTKFGAPTMKGGKLESSVINVKPPLDAAAQRAEYEEAMRKLQELINPYTRGY